MARQPPLSQLVGRPSRVRYRGRLEINRQCRNYSRQVEPDPAEVAARYGAETPVLDWRERLVCSRCGSRQAEMVVSGTKRPRNS